ncbi:kinase-like domain-containing protein [Tuber brumale]|nr:kinase-like domain-containing protein [Tuber brumale]
MPEPQSVTTNGTSGQAPSTGIPDDGNRQGHHPQRPKKTSIQGSTGTWVLGKTIGAGSMGKVKLARRLDTSEQVAVKIVPRQVIQDQGIDPATGQPYPPRHDDSKEVRTAREAAIVTLLDHPYICGMRDVIKTNNHWYMLCEYVNGGQMLDYIISHGRLKEKQARKFGRQIASALDYCHRNSIVHRDLKIENILISKTGDIKIIDFGLSNLFSPRSHLKTFCGSLYFAAPELLQAKQYIGPEVDVWSFGIVLYVLVCGKVPFDDQSMPALHAKIKRGVVDYPQWLTSDCRNLLARMLVTDPRNRASLQEILNHPWLLKGFHGPPDNHLPHREPLTLPLDPQVVREMTGFEFGAAETITAQLSKIIDSEDYQSAVRNAASSTPLASPNPERKKGFGFDFYKRRSSASSKDTLTNPSSEILTHHPMYPDPINAYNPLISIYYLVREKLEKERRLTDPPAQLLLPAADAEKFAKMTIPKQPEAAHTSETSYEFKGQPAPAGGRTRPRARTHGDEEVSEAMKNVNHGGVSLPPSPVIPQHVKEEAVGTKKESTVGGMLRRFSTRRHNASRSDASRGDFKPPPPPTLSLQPPSGPPQADIAAPRKSLSVRRPPGSSRGEPKSAVQAVQPDLLTPPTTSDGGSKRSSKLGRSTSVSEADWRRRYSRNHPGDPPGTSGSERSISVRDDGAVSDRGSSTSKATTARAKSLSHGRREEASGSRRSRKDEAIATPSVPNELPEEDGADAATSVGSADGQNSATLSSDYVKPVFLKGLFSVATTSTKPPVEIRMDIIRVLKQLGVSYREIRGGFTCVHRPSIDLKSVQDNPSPQSPEATNMVTTSSHRRKLSFGGTSSSNPGSGAGQPPPHKSSGKRNRERADTSYTNSDVSNESMHDGVLGGSLILQFEIYIVKVPLLALHGVQFKSVNKTNTWQYKSLASRILAELRL